MRAKDGCKLTKVSPVRVKNGEPIVAYICSYMKLMDYFVLKNKDGKIIKSVFSSQKDTLSCREDEGEYIEEMHYSGCPYWNRETPSIDDFL